MILVDEALSVVVEGGRWLMTAVRGGGSAMIAGALAGTLAVAFTLGGVWALRGRPGLKTPTCRRCASRLRGAGLALPETCPECGAALTDRRAVQWVRFRKQALTLAITAPVVLLGGSLLAVFMALWLMHLAEDAGRHLRRPRPRDVAREITALAAAPPQELEGAVAEDDSGLPAIGGADATVGDDRPPAPRLAAEIGAVREQFVERSNAALNLRLLCVGLDEIESAHGADESLIDQVRELAAELLEGRWVESGYSGDINGPLSAQPLLERLHRLGAVDDAWIRARLARPNSSISCVVPGRARPNSVVGVRIDSSLGLDVNAANITALLIDGAESLPEQPVRVVDGGLTAAGFPVPAAIGVHDVIVRWTEPHVVWNPESLDLELRPTSREATVSLDVQDAPELLEPVDDPDADPFRSRAASVLLEIRRCGARDAIVIDWAVPSRLQLAGTWSVHVDGEWRPITDAGAAGDRTFGYRLIRPPASGWSDTIELRFDPHPEPDRLVLPPLPSDLSPVEGMDRFIAGATRSRNGAWNRPTTLRLTRMPEQWRYLWRP